MSTYGVPGDPPFSVLKTATRTLDSSQITGLNSTPRTLVAAVPGAVIIPLTFSASLNYVSTFTNGGKRITLRMGSNVDFTKNNPLWKTSILDSAQTSNRLATGSVGWVGNYGVSTAYINQPITIYAETAYKGGTGSTVTFTCLYYELTV